MDYVRITDERELAEHLQTGDAAILCGGTDLLVKMRSGLATPKRLLDISDLAALRSIRYEGDVLVVGAATPETEVLEHPNVEARLPLLATALKTLGSLQIRNRASIGGNLVNASPAADSAIALLVYDATVEIVGSEGARTLPVSEFFVGPGRTVLAPAEYIRAIRVPIPEKPMTAFFHKVGKRRALTISIASVGALLRVDGDTIREARFAAGSVAPTPLRLTELEAFLEGRTLSDALVDEARALAARSVSPIDDVRATAAYRRTVVGDLVARALDAAQTA